jgi:hypothetical protein
LGFHVRLYGDIKSEFSSDTAELQFNKKKKKKKKGEAFRNADYKTKNSAIFLANFRRRSWVA